METATQTPDQKTEKPKFNAEAFLRLHLDKEKHILRIKHIAGTSYRVNWMLHKETDIPGLNVISIAKSRMLKVDEANGIVEYARQ